MVAVPNEEELKFLEDFVRAFIPKHRRSRWLSVLKGPPSKWSRLNMDDLFQTASTSGIVRPVYLDDNEVMEQVGRKAEAFLFRFSSEPYFISGCVTDLVDEVVRDDSVIVVPRKNMALAYHHSDGWALCRKNKSV